MHGQLTSLGGIGQHTITPEFIDGDDSGDKSVRWPVSTLGPGDITDNTALIDFLGAPRPHPLPTGDNGLIAGIGTTFPGMDFGGLFDPDPSKDPTRVPGQTFGPDDPYNWQTATALPGFPSGGLQDYADWIAKQDQLPEKTGFNPLTGDFNPEDHYRRYFTPSLPRPNPDLPLDPTWSGISDTTWIRDTKPGPVDRPYWDDQRVGYEPPVEPEPVAPPPPPPPPPLPEPEPEPAPTTTTPDDSGNDDCRFYWQCETDTDSD